MNYDFIVVGAGQAGLAMGYYLRSMNVSFLILDKSFKIGEVWRNRYDSLKLFTPNAYNSLPGLSISNNTDAYPLKNDVANYLVRYAKYFDLPVKLNTEVLELFPEEKGFNITTNQGEFHATNVIIATGPFQQPFVPEFASELPETVLQLHSSQYKNPDQLIQGSVLVIGGGNSGAQIAAELAGDREVLLSIGQKMRFLPQDFAGKSIFWWFEKSGILNVNVENKLGQFLKNQPDPIFGHELKFLIKNEKVRIKPRTKSIRDNAIQFEDGSELKVNNVIWSTGFQSDYTWIKVPNLLNKNGKPIHRRGITNTKGLYFLGLPWQYRRGSALLQGIGYDAKYLYEHLKKNRV